MKTHIPRSKRSDVVGFYKTYNKPHTITRTTQSEVLEDLETGRTIIISDNPFSKKDMFFLFSVHNRAKKLDIERYKTTPGIKYNHFYPQLQLGYMCNDHCEIDVSGAYWEFAYQSGIISGSVYKRGLKVSKIVRLATLGSLATSKVTYQWDTENRKYEKIGYKRNETFPLFFYVAKYFGEWISGVCADTRERFGFDAVSGFWVDAIFCKDGEVSEFVKSRILEAGYNFKYMPASVKIERDKNGLVTFFVTDKLTGKTKPFLLESECKDEVLAMAAERVGDEIKEVRKFFG